MKTAIPKSHHSNTASGSRAVNPIIQHRRTYPRSESNNLIIEQSNNPTPPQAATQ